MGEKETRATHTTHLRPRTATLEARQPLPVRATCESERCAGVPRRMRPGGLARVLPESSPSCEPAAEPLVTHVSVATPSRTQQALLPLIQKLWNPACTF